VNIRRATPEDAAAIAEIYNEAILTTVATFDLEPKSVADRAEWLRLHADPYPVLVAELGGRVVGFGALAPYSDRAAYRETAETALYVHSTHRGQGIGRRLNAAIIDEARQLGFHSLIARISEGSDASLHLNQEAGFRDVGTLKEVGRKFGRLLDVHILQKVLD
jgi:L-amino acid N-acyltransferase YncA